VKDTAQNATFSYKAQSQTGNAATLVTQANAEGQLNFVYSGAQISFPTVLLARNNRETCISSRSIARASCSVQPGARSELADNYTLPSTYPKFEKFLPMRLNFFMTVAS
jgi:hypothetical protein